MLLAIVPHRLVLLRMSVGGCRYSATDHTQYNQSLAHCPQEAVCRNCMPLGPEEVETCWAIDTPILYTLSSFGKVKAQGLGGRNEHLMMSEVFQRGPIVCSIATPDAFDYGQASFAALLPIRGSRLWT